RRMLHTSAPSRASRRFLRVSVLFLFFFFNHSATTHIYTLYLHDALPISSIDIMGLQAAYANLHTDQERDYFMQRYHDVISSFGGKTSYDADNRPLLVMRSNLWASGYDVDGTD